MILLEPEFITPVPIPSENLKAHAEAIKTHLSKIIPASALTGAPSDLEAWLKKSLPLIHTTPFGAPPDVFSLILLSAYREGMRTEHFFLEMIKHGLLPEQEASILGFQQMRFYFKNLSDASFSLVEAKIFVENKQVSHLIGQRLPNLSLEIINGAAASDYAKYLLSTKSFSKIAKTSLIRQQLNQVIRRYPHHVNFHIFEEMEKLLAVVEKEFINLRMPGHIAKLICGIHLLRADIFHLAISSPLERHLRIKLLPASLVFPFSKKATLGLLVALRSLDKYELFSEEHVAAAVQKWIPGAEIVKGSEYHVVSRKEGIKIVYLELEKKEGGAFTLEEKRLLKSSLSKDLERRVEKLVPAIFMIRNEEEVLRNILTLSQEIRSTSDLPHVMISLDRQTPEEVVFTVILIHVCRKKPLHLKEQFEKIKGNFLFSTDRVQIVGYIRKKYPIEAHVFRLHMQKNAALLRSDFSLNFYLARQKVVSLLSEAVGEFRDFNGGIIVKQGEALIELKGIFRDENEKYPELLENFFYGLTPIEMQATLNIAALGDLFRICYEALEAPLTEKSSFWMGKQERGDTLFVSLKGKDLSLKDVVADVLQKTELHRDEIVTTSADFQGSPVFGFLLKTGKKSAHALFFASLQKAVSSWQEAILSRKTLKIALPLKISHLDPRIGADEVSSSLIRLLFEGLTRIGPNGKVELGMAKSVATAPDGKRYVFTLRKALWTNASQVTAYDFEYAWRSVLLPNFPSFFSYLFSPIKNAQKVKQGILSADSLGVRALDEETLAVDLEHPAPYFLELVAHTIFSPVNHLVDKIFPHWPLQKGSDFACNGAYALRINNPDQGFKLVKNPSYWDSARIQTDEILLSRMSTLQGVQLFKKGEVDWIGIPFGLYESSLQTGLDEAVVCTPPVGTFIWKFNAQRYPFHHSKLRKALSLALKREELLPFLQPPIKPAFSFLAPLHSQIQRDLQNELEDPKKAKELFAEALAELKIDKEAFPVITLAFLNNADRKIVAEWTKKQWEKTLGIQCRLEPLEWEVMFEQMLGGDFQITGSFWRPTVNDPIYTLNFFRYFTHAPGYTRWDHQEFLRLVQKIDHETDPERRLSYLKKTEEILIEEAPVIPIFHTGYKAIVKSHISPSANNPLGIVDLKWTRIEPRKKSEIS